MGWWGWEQRCADLFRSKSFARFSSTHSLIEYRPAKWKKKIESDKLAMVKCEIGMCYGMWQRPTYRYRALTSLTKMTLGLLHNLGDGCRGQNRGRDGRGTATGGPR